MERVNALDQRLRTETQRLIVERLRSTFWIAWVGIAGSLLFDVSAGGPPWPIATAKTAAILGLPLAMLVVSRLVERPRSVLVGAGIAVLWLVNLVAVIGGVVTGDPTRVAFVVSFLAFAVAVFVPWGIQAHATWVGLIVVACIVAFNGSNVLGTVPFQSLCAAAAATTSSLYIASSLEKQRMARRRAELLVEQQARDLRAQTVELVAARDEALASTRVRSEFLANMSHEMRTPLHGVLGLTDILLDSDLPPDLHELAESIRRCGQTLSTLVDDVLDFERLAAGELTLRSEVFDPAAVLREATVMLLPTAQQKQLAMNHQVAAELPGLVEGDRVRFLQIVTNLVSNAIKFTDAGEVTIALSVLGRSTAHAILRFEVRDTGIGIPAELHEVIFEAFRQADGSMTRAQGGTGLGLTIARQLAEMMDGRIGLESAPGEGSTFWVELPLRLVDGADLRATG